MYKIATHGHQNQQFIKVTIGQSEASNLLQELESNEINQQPMKIIPHYHSHLNKSTKK